MDVYLVIGDREVGKSTLIRSLTGVGSLENRKIKKILDLTIWGKIKRVYVEHNSLQEIPQEADDFVRQIKKVKVDVVLVSLWLTAGTKRRSCKEYINVFSSTKGWEIKGAALLGNNAQIRQVNLASDIISDLTNPSMNTANWKAGTLRIAWGWA